MCTRQAAERHDSHLATRSELKGRSFTRSAWASTSAAAAHAPARGTGLDDADAEGNSCEARKSAPGQRDACSRLYAPRSAIVTSSVSPERCETMTAQLSLCDSCAAWIDSEIVPIWLILSSRPLQAFFSMAVLMRSGFVTGARRQDQSLGKAHTLRAQTHPSGRRR